MTPSLYIALDLTLLAAVIAGMAMVGQDPLWITGFALIWLAISAVWLVLDAWWRRQG